MARFPMLHDVVLAQQREWQGLLSERYIPRSSVPPTQPSDLIQVVIGPRRAGKSMYAAHLGAAREGGCGYVNFDDERLINLEDNDVFIAAVDGIYGKPRTLVLDEIQNLPRWELLAALHRTGAWALKSDWDPLCSRTKSSMGQPSAYQAGEKLFAHEHLEVDQDGT